MRRSLLVMVAVASVTAIAAAVMGDVLLRDRPVDGEAYDRPTVTQEDLLTVNETRVFFAHQSVGGNILDGLPHVYQAHGLATPRVVELADADLQDRLVHTRVGKNGDPLGKIRAFDSLLREGLGDTVDVAVLKLCYSDVRDETDIDAVFDAYTTTLSTLQRDFPDVSFVAATVPLSTQRSHKENLKELLGRGNRYGAEHNVARERFNALLRAEYTSPGALFDVAAIESTAPDGTRVAAVHRGSPYYSLAQEYAKDPGHLNDAGGAAAAEGLLSAIATSRGR